MMDEYPLYHPDYTGESNPTLSNHDPITRELIKESELNSVLLHAIEKYIDDEVVIYTLLGICIILTATLFSVHG